MMIMPMHCGFQGGEFTELSTFENKCLVHFMVCPCHVLLLTPMLREFLAGEFSELSTF